MLRHSKEGNFVTVTTFLGSLQVLISFVTKEIIWFQSERNRSPFATKARVGLTNKNLKNIQQCSPLVRHLYTT